MRGDDKYNIDRLIHDQMKKGLLNGGSVMPQQPMIPVVTVGEFQFVQNLPMLTLYYLALKAKAGDEEARAVMSAFMVNVTDVHGKPFYNWEDYAPKPPEEQAPDIGGSD